MIKVLHYRFHDVRGFSCVVVEIKDERLTASRVIHMVSLEVSPTDSPKPDGPSDGSGWNMRWYLITATTTVYS